MVRSIFMTPLEVAVPASKELQDEATFRRYATLYLQHVQC